MLLANKESGRRYLSRARPRKTCKKNHPVSHIRILRSHQIHQKNTKNTLHQNTTHTRIRTPDDGHMREIGHDRYERPRQHRLSSTLDSALQATLNHLRCEFSGQGDRASGLRPKGNWFEPRREHALPHL